jgi:hypothetical protein
MNTFKFDHNKFKPSELPIDTVIDDQERGTFRKDAPGLWAELQYREMGQQELVWDEGGQTADRKTYGSKSIEMPSDEYFKDFKVLSLPISVVEYIVEEFAKMTGSEVVLDEAIEAVKMEQDTPKNKLPKDDWHHLSSFERWYAEMNSDGWVKTDWDGKIYKPVFDEDLNIWVVSFIDPNDGEMINLDVRYFIKQLFSKNYI